jgi:cobalt-zinc-cadmium resistance protein CzcA
LFIYKSREIIFLFDSLIKNFSKASNRRFELGETNYLENNSSSNLDKTSHHKLKVIRAHIMDLFIDSKDDKIVIKNNSITLLFNGRSN